MHLQNRDQRVVGLLRRPGTLDLFIILLLAALTGLYAWTALDRADPRFFRSPDGDDVWFEADVPIVSDLMLHRWHDQKRNVRHPLFPLLATGPVYAFKYVGLDDASALGAFVVCAAAAWSATLYLLILGLTRRRLDAVVFSLLGHVTAAAIFWLPVPETYTFGSISVMAALALSAWDPSLRFAERWYVAAAAGSLAITSSNWATGLSVLMPRFRWRRSVQITANSLCVVVLLWAVQHRFAPSAPFFLGSDVQSRFVLVHGVGGIPGDIRALLFHSVVMPVIRILPDSVTGAKMLMSVQESALASTGTAGAVATLLWAALLVLGVWGLTVTPSTVRLPLVLALAAQIAVFSIYGDETFLYTLHVAPILVSIVALSTHTKARPVALGTAAVLIVLLAINNVRGLAWASAFFENVSK